MNDQPIEAEVDICDITDENWQEMYRRWKESQDAGIDGASEDKETVQRDISAMLTLVFEDGFCVQDEDFRNRRNSDVVSESRLLILNLLWLHRRETGYQFWEVE